MSQVIQLKRNSCVSSLKKHLDAKEVTCTWLLQSSADSMIARVASWITSSGKPTMSNKRRTWRRQYSCAGCNSAEERVGLARGFSCLLLRASPDSTNCKSRQKILPVVLSN